MHRHIFAGFVVWSDICHSNPLNQVTVASDNGSQYAQHQRITEANENLG